MTVKQIHIEKYDIGAFEKEQKPYAMILTDVIQNAPADRIEEVFMWIYLETLPTTWKPCKQHLMQRFNISERTYERRMSWLNTCGLLEYRQTRENNGSFGKGTLVILNGTRFNPHAVPSRTAKIDGTVVNRLKSAQIVQLHRTAISPVNGETEASAGDGHINTIKISKKDISKKINNRDTLVSIFSDKPSVINFIEKVLANRKGQEPLDDDVIDQGCFYCFEKNNDKSFDSVNLRINIFLKKVREGKWLIPQGWNGITSQSVREKDEEHQKQKEIQIQEDAKISRQLFDAVKTGKGFAEFQANVKRLKGA